MAATDARTRSAAVDVVALLRKSDFQQVAEKARAMKATVRETSKVMEHPVEDGTTITDHRVIMPVEIDLSVMLADEDFRGTYQALKTLFTSAELLIVQTVTDNYADMMIVEMPHEETTEMVGAVPVAVKLKEVKTAKAQYGSLPPRAVARKSDSSTTKRGEVSGQEASPEQKKQAKSIASDKYDKWFGGK